MDLNNKKNVKTLIFIITVSIFIFLGLQNIDILVNFLNGILSILTPVFIGLAFAFIFNVPLRFVERRIFTRKDGSSRVGKARRPLSLVISVLLVLGIIAAIMFLVIPELITSLTTLIQSLPDTFIRFQEWVERLSEEHPQVQEFLMSTNINWDDMLNSVLGWVQDFSINIVSQAFNIVVSTVSFVVNIGLGFILSIYFLTKKEQLSSQFKKLTYAFIPESKADTIVYVFKLTGDTFSRSVAGSLTECTILATITMLAMMIFNFPYAMMVGCIVGIMALIPMFGVVIGIVIGAFLILTVNPVQALWFVVMMIIIQQIEGNLIYPRVAANAVGLPSLWVMVTIIVGGGMFGFIGMLISVPIASVIYTILRRVVHVRLRKRRIPKNKYKVQRTLVTAPIREVNTEDEMQKAKKSANLVRAKTYAIKKEKSDTKKK